MMRMKTTGPNMTSKARTTTTMMSPRTMSMRTGVISRRMLSALNSYLTVVCYYIISQTYICSEQKAPDKRKPITVSGVGGELKIDKVGTL